MIVSLDILLNEMKWCTVEDCKEESHSEKLLRLACETDMRHFQYSKERFFQVEVSGSTFSKN